LTEDTPSPLPKLLTIKQSSKVLGTTDDQTRELVNTRRIRYVAIGKRKMIPPDAIDAFILENTVQPECREEMKVPNSALTPAAASITSPGQKAVAHASAQRLRQIANKLKSRSPNSSTSAPAQAALVIPLKSS
jgi:excisionase family DNA binding protein